MTAEPALQVGISVVPATDTLDRIRELVGAADETGLDLLDHLPRYPIQLLGNFTSKRLGSRRNHKLRD